LLLTLVTDFSAISGLKGSGLTRKFPVAGPNTIKECLPFYTRPA